MLAELLFRTTGAARSPIRHRMRWPGEAKPSCGEMVLYPQVAFVTRPDCNAVVIEPFQQRYHDTSRASQRLAQLAHSCGSVFGNEFGHLRLHALKTLAQ